MYINKVISYMNAWEEISQKSNNELFEIIEAINGISYEKMFQIEEEMRTTKGIVVNILGKCLNKSLDEMGWKQTRTKRRMVNLGYFKNNITVDSMLSRHSFDSWLIQRVPLGIKAEICKIPVTIFLTKENNNEYFKRSPLDNFENIEQKLNLIAPLSINYPFLVFGISEKESIFELYNIPSIMEGYNENVVVNRSIEFPPEYYQAGLGILSYFNNILKEKYPDTPANVKIIQEDLVVRMIIESENGNKEVIEKALEEYEQIINGKIKPEEYLTSAAKVLELKSELRIAQVRLENQIDIINFQRTEIQVLKEIISKGLATTAQIVHSKKRLPF
ncbi:hypothetical protein [Paenibacillus anseongense]|uniref:hypothetical protein n=1 Tax=Paenibacillus anseongense TaxID=2682845 RepID=UPI002DB6DFE5|nr:hypothetical protein [Paenibacillus anseongense]MEC0269364.1 hypothetical protein [Paenibacillus anseongense]